MSQITPYQVLAQVANAAPEHCREHIVIIGSLAAGYHFFGDDRSKVVRTKASIVFWNPSTSQRRPEKKLQENYSEPAGNAAW